MYHDINQVTDTVNDILKNYQQAAMGTFAGDYPEVTKVTPIVQDDTIYLLLSDLSTHTRNIQLNNKITLYFAMPHVKRTEMNNKRVTLYGTLEALDTDSKLSMLTEFDQRDPGASMYGTFSDFRLYRFTEVDRLYIEGFGQAYR